MVAFYAFSDLHVFFQVKFQWKPNNPAKIQPTAKLNIGFLAQEVEEVFPEVIHQQPTGFLGVDYPHFAPILVEAIKEQQYIIEKQSDRIDQLELALDRERDDRILELSEVRAEVNLLRKDKELAELRASLSLLQKEIKRLQEALVSR